MEKLKGEVVDTWRAQIFESGHDDDEGQALAGRSVGGGGRRTAEPPRNGRGGLKQGRGDDKEKAPALAWLSKDGEEENTASRRRERSPCVRGGGGGGCRSPENGTIERRENKLINKVKETAWASAQLISNGLLLRAIQMGPNFTRY